METRRSFIRNASLAGTGLLLAPTLNKAWAFEKVGRSEAPSLRYRQVHLDFHTSGLIEDVAKDFDPEAFADKSSRAVSNRRILTGVSLCARRFRRDKRAAFDFGRVRIVS